MLKGNEKNESQMAYNYFCRTGKKLTFDELIEALKAVGVFLPAAIKKEKEEEFKKNTSEDKGWSYEEFEKMVFHFTHEINNQQEILEAFRIFDGDGSGSISAEELKHIMTTLGERMTEDEINELLKEADTNGDGVIDYKEFTNVLMS